MLIPDSKWGSLYRVDDQGLSPGQILLQGRWGKIIIETGEKHTQYHRENILEIVRQAEFPKKPSRLSASYVFPLFEAADLFHKWRWDDGCKQCVYLVGPVDVEAACHLGEINCLPPIEKFDETEIARAYWRGDQKAFGRDFTKLWMPELLIDSPLIVFGCLTEPF